MESGKQPQHKQPFVGFDLDHGGSERLLCNSGITRTRQQAGNNNDGTNSSSSSNNNNNNNNNAAKEPFGSNRTTDAQTMMHILKANIGTGVLAMPNAFKNVGLWLGFILVPIIGAICIHCMNILIESHNHLCDRFNYESLDYDQVAALGLACGPKFTRRLAKKAHIVVTTFLVFTQFGFCCVYIMFVVENLQLAVLNLLEIEYSTTTYLLLVFPIIGLTSCTSNLKHLARISTLANLLQLTGLALIFYDLLQFHTYKADKGQQQQQQLDVTLNNELLLIPNETTSTTTSALKQPEVSPLVSNDIWAGLPLFFATAVYAFEGIGVVLPLIKEMEYPARISGLNGVLNTSMSMVAILYMAMGFFGYAKYGILVQGSITLNLPETTLNELVRMIFAIAIGLSYSLQFYVPWTIMWPQIDESLFYSYRPRASRDKLQILSRLSAENEWAIDESAFIGCSGRQSDLKQHQQQQGHRQQPDGADASENELEQDIEYNSIASTFATSYSMSTCLPAGSQRRRLNLSGSSAFVGSMLPPSHQYGAITASTKQAILSSLSKQQHWQPQRRRNRLEDVMEQEDSMPEVEWRPPPRSMRGKRKLVRYTVILVTVSFTFVAAALIPRLDLFISLIGALASSCLAIIFPAIIQVCTFWRPEEDDEDEGEHDEHDDEDQEDANGDESSVGKDNKRRRRGARKRKSRNMFRLLFVFKNLLLIGFGILGLITGSWISISQLGAVYMGIEPTGPAIE